MKIFAHLLATSLLLVLTACPVALPGTDGGTAGGGTGGSSGGSSGTGGGTAGGLGADGGVQYAPELTTILAQVSGRTGRDLRFTVVGKDRDLNINSLWVRLLDAAGAPVLGTDTDGNGVRDPIEASVSLDNKKYVGEVLSASGVIRGLFDSVQGVAQVAVTLQDSTNLSSAELISPVLDQPVRTITQNCDPLFLADRCSAGLGCRGTPTATCQEGLAPQITRMAFYRGTGGPTILLDGTEPEDDLSTVHFEFQNALGTPISIDSDGDGVPDMASFDLNALGAAVDGVFFLRMQAGDNLDAQVPQLVAIPSDSAGHIGAAKKVAPSNAPVHTGGQACDPRGFDVCSPGLSCAPGIVGATNRCATNSSLHTAECSAAPVLIATAQGATYLGRAGGVSLWDAPAGCSSNDPKGRPEGVVTVRLTTRANTLTLTTARPGTNFDTTMYALTGCPVDSSGALGCNDDAPGTSASTLVLTDMPAGDYLVVVDSFSYAGGNFELLATVN